MKDGHYCDVNSNSPPTGFDFSRGYWAGLTWAATNPAYGVYNFSELDAILQAADAADQYVEVNALVGQCSPKWIYTHGVTALKVNWKPPPTCVPPICVPAGTWNCSTHNGTGCGCDGVTPCNQTFPDYLSSIYQQYLEKWIKATHKHIVGLPAHLRERVLSVQANAGSTGDVQFFHGRLYPEQQNFTGYGSKSVFTDYYRAVMKIYIDTYNVPAGSSKPSVQLLFNGDDDVRDAMIAASSLSRTGYMRKVGTVSHNYGISGEMVKWNAIRPMLQKKLPGGNYVRTRGESTLSASTSWMVHPAWTAWALATWNAAFGMDTWQNNTLIEKQPTMRPALSFFSKYAGSREGKNNAGAWAVLRDGLDVSDIGRWPEAKFGKVSNGHNVDRCHAIINHTAKLQTSYPPRLDSPTDKGCGANRESTYGLNDATYQGYPGNYQQFLEQVDEEGTSIGAWRIGPSDEIFGRYGRSALPGGGLFFRSTGSVFAGYSTVYARVVFYDSGAASAWKLSYSGKGGCVTMAKVTGKGTGHWIEARFKLQSTRLPSSKCPQGSDVTLTDLTPKNNHPVVFNLIELSKEPFDFTLSPYQLDGAPAFI